jgi:Niemann-Pick C1 protein
MVKAESIATTITKNDGPLYRDPIWPFWTRCTNVLHTIIRSFVATLSVHAARFPKSYALAITIISLSTLAIGLFTNFTIETKYEVIYAPSGKRPTEYLDWIYRPDTGFPDAGRPITLLLHNQGSNVISKQGLRQVFQAIEMLMNIEGYSEACAQSEYSMKYPNGTKTENACNIIGTTRYWYYDSKLFEEDVETDLQVIHAISNETYPDGLPVYRDFILGQYELSNRISANDTIAFAKSFQETILLPDTISSIEFETKAIENLLALQQQWRQDAAREESEGLQERTMQLEFFTMNSYSTEFQKAIFKDLPLTVLVGAIMVVFTCLVYFKRDPVQSRSLLGIAAVFTITMSMAFAHGLMFAAGVPFTNMTMMLPFVVFGVGLDDTFIVTGAFFRTDPNKDTVERIRETMEEVGSSISLTTITTMVAFALGYTTSSIPAIQWLCLYAFLSITVVFIFQITLFTAFLVLDERRMKASKRDLCFCFTVKREIVTDREGGDERQGQEEADTGEDAETDIMTRYADFLMRPAVKAIVLVTFLGYFGFCTYRATLLTQEFIVSEFLPAESYVADYLDAVDDYAMEMVALGVYFRGIDQSNETVQQQMRDYIDDLINLEQLGTPPPFCWVRDLANEELFSEESIGFNISSWSFNEKLNLAMTDPRIRQVYGDDIVRDEDGNITSSRCYLFLSNIDFDVVQSQIKMLNDQSAVTVSQPLNQGQAKFRMFAFTDMMFLWQFYSVCVSELTSTTIAGVVSVTIVAFLLIPHWTAVFYVFPIIVILYLDMLGKCEYRVQWQPTYVIAPCLKLSPFHD